MPLRIVLAVVVTLMLPFGSARAQGPVILSGEDPDQILSPHLHCGGFGCEGLYGYFLRCLINNATDPTPDDPDDPARILVVGAEPIDTVIGCVVNGGNPGESMCGVQEMIDAAAVLPANSCGDPMPHPIVDLANDFDILSADFTQYSVIIVPSTDGQRGEGVTVRGGITCNEIGLLASRTGEDPTDGTTMSITTFVNDLGRGLMAFSERGEDFNPFTGQVEVTGCDNAFSFLPGCFTFGYPPGFDKVTETLALEEFGMELPVDGIDHLAYHNTFTGPVTGTDPDTGLITEVAGLQVLARKEEAPRQGEPVIIGGQSTTISVCNAGGPYEATCTGGEVRIDLDGTGSVAVGGATWDTDCVGAFFEPGDDQLTPVLVIPAVEGCQADCNVSLTVTDECGVTETCSSTVAVGDTTPPTLNVPPGLMLECSAPGGVPLSDATVLAWLASATAEDNCGNATVTDDAPGLFPSGCPPAGASTVVTFTATDDCGNETTGTSTVTVVDSLPPDISVQPDLGEGGCGFLWPPMHGYADFSVDDTGVVAVDVCDGVFYSYSSCDSSQPENAIGLGDGDSEKDCVASEDLQEIALRAERDGACAPLDRIYTMTLDVTDSCGNFTTSDPFSLCVYHDKGHRPPKTGPVYHAQPDSNQNDERPGLNGSYGLGCGEGCSLECDPTQALP